MKRFQFRLDRLLALRAFHERRAELAFAEKAGACAVLEARLAENLERSARNAREMFAPGRELPDFRAAELFSRRLLVERGRVTAELAAAELEREAARAVFIAKRRDREAVDKLRERREAEYYRLAWREETKVLDDLARRPAAKEPTPASVRTAEAAARAG